MFSDLCLTSVLDRAGQTSTQMPQPVQSSGATWTISRWSFSARSLYFLCWKLSGASANASSGASLIRIAVCGQVIAHLPQSMHSDGSQIGSSTAIARFSHFDVPVGQVPSTGNALTGSRSPCPRIIAAVTRRTKSGASSGIGGSRCSWLVGRSGTCSGSSAATAASIAAKLRSTTVRPRWP